MIIALDGKRTCDLIDFEEIIENAEPGEVVYLTDRCPLWPARSDSLRITVISRRQLIADARCRSDSMFKRTSAKG